jgi:hypothetical protein
MVSLVNFCKCIRVTRPFILGRIGWTLVQDHENGMVTPWLYALLPVTILVVDTYLVAFETTGLCNLLVHKSMANARDETIGCLHVNLRMSSGAGGKSTSDRQALTPDLTLLH